mmetsp:Transcript_89431/g.239179  ORF Transcript_89431/g.239179 Transcript_89431/m.239179 type:complete len:105 (+) Transcript_89431:56-370(+)
MRADVCVPSAHERTKKKKREQINLVSTLPQKHKMQDQDLGGFAPSTLGIPRLSENRVRDLGQTARFHVPVDLRHDSERKVSSWLKHVKATPEHLQGRRPSITGP